MDFWLGINPSALIELVCLLLLLLLLLSLHEEQQKYNTLSK